MKRVLSVLLSFVIVCSCFSCISFTSASAASFTARTTAPSASNVYYLHTSYGGLNECIHISGGSVLPNCVGYAWGRAYEILGSRPNLPKTDANTWYNNNKSSGAYSYGSTPKLGAILCWSGGSSGHVAVVEEINGSTITISESHYGGTRFNIRTGTQSEIESYISGFQGYIYIGDFGEPVNNPVLAKNFEGMECSNGMEITFTWNEINNMTGYNLYVAKNIEGTVNYDWSNARIYLPGTNSTQHTFSKGALSVGNYAAYVQAVNIDTGEKSEQSNFIYFSIFDDESLKSPISLAKSFNGNTCSSAENITFSWSTVSGMTGYNLYVAKNIEGTVNYDWSNARIYLPGDTTSLYTMTKGTKSAGNYAAYIQAVNLSTGYTSRQSNFIYFNIVDDIWFDIYTQPEAIYDIGKTDSFKVRGWAVNTGKQEVSCYLSIDDRQEILLDKQQRTDVSGSSLYSDFCPSEFVGFIGEVDLSKYDIGKHTIKVVAKSLTAEKIIFDSSFEIVGIKFGDTDGDGKVTIMDATEIQRHIAQLTTISDDRLTCADTDKDGKVSIMDATMIQRFIAQLIPEL